MHRQRVPHATSLMDGRDIDVKMRRVGLHPCAKIRREVIDFASDGARAFAEAIDATGKVAEHALLVIESHKKGAGLHLRVTPTPSHKEALYFRFGSEGSCLRCLKENFSDLRKSALPFNGIACAQRNDFRFCGQGYSAARDVS